MEDVLRAKLEEEEEQAIKKVDLVKIRAKVQQAMGGVECDGLQQWPKAIELLTSHPKVALLGDEKHNNIPLLWAIQAGNAEEILGVLNANPTAFDVSVAQNTGKLVYSPLAFAIIIVSRGIASIDNLKVLLDKYPSSVDDKQFRLPDAETRTGWDGLPMDQFSLVKVLDLAYDEGNQEVFDLLYTYTKHKWKGTKIVTQDELEKSQASASSLREALEMMQNPEITVLELRDANLGDAGVTEIVRKLSKSSITALDLSGNNIGEDGAHALALVLATEHCRIAWLSLQDNNIGSAGARCFANEIVNKNFWSCGFLVLSGNGLGDNGVFEMCKTLQIKKNR